MIRARAVIRLAAVIVPLLALGATPATAACSDPPAPGVDWSSCHKDKKLLKGQDMRGGHFARTDFSMSSLSGANLAGAVMERANLAGTSLRQADLSRASLIKVLGSRANFEGATLVDTTLSKAELARANMSGADLTGADLSKTELERALLTGARLQNADLTYADLARARLNQAVLAGAKLTGAYMLLTRLEGTDLSAVAGLTQAQLEITCGDAETKLPEGLVKPAAWPCPAVEAEE